MVQSTNRSISGSLGTANRCYEPTHRQWAACVGPESTPRRLAHLDALFDPIPVRRTDSSPPFCATRSGYLSLPRRAPRGRSKISIIRRMSLTSATVPALATSTKSLRGTPGQRVQLPLPCTKYRPFQHAQTKMGARRLRSGALICAAALSARCAAEQTQTVTRQSSTITIAPIQGKEKSPELDDGGTGFPPRDDDGGGGGGGGGGGHWSGGFFFFGLLAFLGLMKDQESEGPYQNNKRRY
ncbi:hypothetical protein MUK42_37258 [Musa troglodytarum]|uniref:Uncharacterized protein n=1 Tax=Musa troglodytarum TaxID=320322 RepID=A0A9E7EAK8_9LILI|nr:hypothetical protein MUK42_37258 [Musa troglodytarum]